MFWAHNLPVNFKLYFPFKLNVTLCYPGQVPILLLIYSQCCSKGEIYCIRIIRGRDRSASNWTKTWNWSSRTCWWDIFWHLWQIWTGQWTDFGQLLYINGELLSLENICAVCCWYRLTVTHLKLVYRVMMLLLTLSRLWMTFSTCIHW